MAWSVSFGAWRQWGRTALRHTSGRRILELAHGPGHLQLAMAERGITPTGLDLSKHMGRLAQRRLRRAGASAPLVQARAQALPFRAACFDSVVATFPTEFIFARATLSEAARVLRPRGEDGQAGRLVVVNSIHFDKRSLLWRMLAMVYRLTGQTDEQYAPAWTEALADARRWFAVRSLAEPVGRTLVDLLVGEKL